jgi:GNAT superfamily N-acetyltransferase
MPEWVVEELIVPESVTDDYAAAIEIMNQNEAEAYGTDDLRLRPEESLPWWRDDANPHRLFGVRVDGGLVACASMDWLAADTDNVWVRVNVLRAFRHQGIGSALSAHVESVARADGRGKMVTFFPSPDAPGDRIEAPTGFGSVPAGNPEVRFALAQGFRLEQVERGSRLSLPVTVAVEPPAGYRLHYWINHTPPEWLEQVAILNTRMSTDAPSAGLEEPEDVHTVERILEQEARIANGPRSYLYAAVEHVESGTLAGFTNMSVPGETDRSINQYSTLVLKEHRGHRLGMLLKLANLDHLQRARPGHPSVITFNAEENRYMLDVNEQVGFEPMGYEGAWRKDLA